MVGLGLGCLKDIWVSSGGMTQTHWLRLPAMCWCHIVWASKNAQVPASFRSGRWVTCTFHTRMNKLKLCSCGYLCMTASIHVWLIAAYGRIIWQQTSPTEGSRLDSLVFSSIPLFLWLALWFSQAEQPIKVTPLPGCRWCWFGMQNLFRNNISMVQNTSLA